MNKQALSLAVCIAGAYPLSSGAIGLGDIRSSSHLNQPLNAKIELLSISNKEAAQIQVRLASVDVFNRVGIDRPAYLNSLKFTSSIQNGKPVILVSSNQPIKEPFLNFLLEVSWPQGQLLKEYTVLLDPPVLMQAGNTASNNTASIRAEPKATGFVKRAPQTVETAPTANNQVTLSTPPHLTKPANTPKPRTSTSKYRVKSGDTLYKVAARVKTRGVSTDQMMVALFRANPNAFRNGNINSLKAGITLSVPSSSSAKTITTSQAKQAVRQHYTEWKQFRKKLAGQTVAQTALSTPPTASNTANTDSISRKNNAHLEVMGNTSDSKPNSDVAAAGKANISKLEKQLYLAQESLLSKKRENTELKSRVTDLQSLLQKKDHLISLKNDQIAKLQKSFQNTGKTAPTIGDSGTVPTGSALTPTDSLTGVNNNDLLNTPNSNETPFNPNNTENSTTPNLGGDTATETANGGLTPAPNSATENIDNNVAPEAPSVGLTPAEIAEKRRISADAINSNTDLQVDDSVVGKTGFKADQENSLLDLLSSPIVAAAGAGAILLLLLLWLLLSRRQEKTDDNDDLIESLDSFDDNFQTTDNDLQGNTKAAKESTESFFSKIEGSTNSQLEQDNSTSSSAIIENSLEIDDDDILQEADVYIVYGLHEQAETELKKAIADHPQKLEYRQKLLENYLASNNKTAFDQHAAELNGLKGSNKTAIWEKVVEMGLKISPDNTLYQGATPTPAAIDTHKETEPTITEQPVKSQDSIATEVEAEKPSALTLVQDTDDNDNTIKLDKEEEFSLDDLEKELDAQSAPSTKDGSNVIDFESAFEEEKSPSNKESQLSLANLNLNVDSKTGIDRILPQGTPYTAAHEKQELPNREEEDDILAFLDLPDEDFDLHEAHISTKLELARAYLDMGDIEGARSTLEEVIVEGSDDQKREAKDLLHQTG